MSKYGLVQVFICIKGFQDVQIGTCSSFISIKSIQDVQI